MLQKLAGLCQVSHSSKQNSVLNTNQKFDKGLGRYTPGERVILLVLEPSGLAR